MQLTHVFIRLPLQCTLFCHITQTDVKPIGEGTQVTTNVSDEYTVSISKVDNLNRVIIHKTGNLCIK